MSLSDFRYSLRALQKNPCLCDSSDSHDRARRRCEHIDFHRRKRRASKAFSFPEAERLVVVNGVSKSLPDMGVSYPDYLDWRAEQRVLSILPRAFRPAA